MKKIRIIIACLFLACSVGVVAFVICSRDKTPSDASHFDLKEGTIELDQINLDQKDAYVSMSKNDIEGYNRWIPFYFSLSGKMSMSESQVESILEKKINSAILYKDNEVIYQTNHLVWSVYKVNDELYNLTLVLIPELSECLFDEIQPVTHIELNMISGDSQKYTLSNYLIEQKETLPENLFSISVSSMETEISDEFTARVNYGIETNGKEIKEFSLEYPPEFSDVKSYEILDTEVEDKNTVYSVSLQLSKDSRKSMFRPFLKIEYDDGKLGYLVPAVPVYFR